MSVNQIYGPVELVMSLVGMLDEWPDISASFGMHMLFRSSSRLRHESSGQCSCECERMSQRSGSWTLRLLPAAWTAGLRLLANCQRLRGAMGIGR